MKKLIRLTESELTTIVRRIVKESSSGIFNKQIKVKAWESKSEKDSGTAQDYNLITTNHKPQNNMVLFDFTTPTTRQNKGILPKGEAIIKCGDNSGIINAHMGNEWVDLFVTDKGRKALTKMCDSYVSNDTEMDSDYA